jgi:phage-related protein
LPEFQRLLKVSASKAAGVRTLVGRRVVMLHQFIKKSEKTPLNELKIVRNRMKEVKDAKHFERL